MLKSYVFNEPIVADTSRLPPLEPSAIFAVFFLKHFMVFYLYALFAPIVALEIWFETLYSNSAVTLRCSTPPGAEIDYIANHVDEKTIMHLQTVRAVDWSVRQL